MGSAMAQNEDAWRNPNFQQIYAEHNSAIEKLAESQNLFQENFRKVSRFRSCLYLEDLL
jgi:hypothetical protein